MVVITVVGILAAFALLASYYAFVTRCQLLRALSSRYLPWRGHGERRRAGREPSVATEARGLALPLIRMLPVVKFTAAADTDDDGMAGRISVSECAVCLSEFVERERVRLLPNCCHAFHIDCIDTWLQGNARCPFCRSDVTLPAAPAPARSSSTTAPNHGDDIGVERRQRDVLISNSIVIEVRGEHESWVSCSTPAGRRVRKQQHKAECVGDEAIDTRKTDEVFAVQPMRRSLSMDSCDKQLYVSVQEFLAQR